MAATRVCQRQRSSKWVNKKHKQNQKPNQKLKALCPIAAHDQIKDLKRKVHELEGQNKKHKPAAATTASAASEGKGDDPLKQK